MSKQDDGVIRIGRKGRKKFAFGEEGEPFEVDVVEAFQEWVCREEVIRDQYEDGAIPTRDMPQYNAAAVAFAIDAQGGPCKGTVTVAEARDFIARLRECYDEVADFFRARSRDEPESPASSGVALVFSEEQAAEAS